MPATLHTSQLICNSDASVMSDIMSAPDLKTAKAAAVTNYQAKFNSNKNWQSAWGAFSNLLANSSYKTS